MGFNLWSRIRGLFPITTRNAEERLSDLALQLERRDEALEVELEAIGRSLHDVSDKCDELQKLLFSSNNANEASFKALRNSLQYVNLEYKNCLCATRERRILIAGWYGAQNFGDELMLRTLISYFPEEALSRITVLLWDNFSYPRFTLDGRIHVIHYPRSTWELETLADMFDVVGWGGGAILDDLQYAENPDNTNAGNLFIRFSELMLDRKKKVYCLALSANRSIQNVYYGGRLARIAASSDVFSVRDPYSIEVICGVGVAQDRVVLCQDIVFANKDLIKVCVERGRQERGDCFKVGIVLLCAERYFTQYKAVLESVHEVLQNVFDSFEMVLIPFLNENECDVGFYRNLKSSLSSIEKDILVANYADDLSKSPLLQCDFCLCYKYHAALIANAAGIPSLNVCRVDHPHYYNKMKYLAELFQYREHLCMSNEFEADPMRFLAFALKDETRPTLDESVLSDTAAWLEQVCCKISDC